MPCARSHSLWALHGNVGRNNNNKDMGQSPLFPYDHGTGREGLCEEKPPTKYNVLLSRVDFRKTVSRLTFSLLSFPVIRSCNDNTAHAFEGGVGGLGKTKPDTGIEFLYPPSQDNAGLVTAEILIGGQTPVLLRFASPWPFLATTGGLEVRDVPNPESTFVQIVTDPATLPTNQPLTKQKVRRELLENNILGPKGKFGAYGSPTDVKVQPVEVNNGDDNNNFSLWTATFTALTPGLRESDRRVFLSCRPVGDSWLVLVAGTTLQRFAKQETVLRKIVDSLEVIQAPPTRRLR